MPRDDDVLANQSCPRLFEIWERNGSVDLGGPGIAADFEAKAPLFGVHEVPFVEGTIMVHREFGVVTEKLRESFEDRGLWRRVSGAWLANLH